MEPSLEPGSLAKNLNVLMARSAQPNSDLGQSTEKRLYWTILLCVMSATRGNQRTPFQWMPLQSTDMGLWGPTNAQVQQTPEQHQRHN